MSIKLQIALWISVLAFVCLTIDTNYAQFADSTPKKFGILITYQSCDQNFELFSKHVETYINMKSCEQIQQIVVVWNCDKIKPEGIINFVSSNRPLRIVTTPYSTADFRFILPKQSTAKVYFASSVQTVIQCQQLKKSFQFWQQNSIGDIGPLVTYTTLSHDINLKSQRFSYVPSSKGKFYTMSSMSATWVSRFFLQLYNVQTNWEITSLRELVKQKNKCQVIAFNFAINYFFPQLHPIFISGNIKIAESTQIVNVNQENACIKKFMQILGYNPLTIKVKSEQDQNNQRFNSAAGNYAIYMRKQQLMSKLFQSSKTTYQLNSTQIQAMEGQMINEISLNKPADKDVQLKIKIEIQQQIDRLFKQIKQKNLSLQNISKKVQELQNSSLLDPNYLKQKQKVQISVTAMKYVSLTSLAIIVILAIIFMCWSPKKQVSQQTTSSSVQIKSSSKQKKSVNRGGNVPDSDSEDD